MSAVRSIQGPIVSTADLERQTALFRDVFGLECVAEETLTAARVEALFGLAGHTATTRLMLTPDTPWGVRLLALSPTSEVEIRAEATGQDADALKVIDFYAPDFDRAVAHLEAHGYRLRHERAEYDLPEGRFVEGHLWGPDGVVCALLGGPAGFFAGFATLTDRLVSEVQSVSAPVSDPEPVLRFYEQVLGLERVYEYAIDDASFGKLVGTGEPLRLQAVNLGLDRREPYLGIIHYGLPRDRYRSLAGRARLPHRGLAGVTIEVAGLDAILARARENGIECLAGPTAAALAPYGPIRSAALRAPHGVLHHLIETGG